MTGPRKALKQVRTRSCLFAKISNDAPASFCARKHFTVIRQRKRDETSDKSAAGKESARAREENSATYGQQDRPLAPHDAHSQYHSAAPAKIDRAVRFKTPTTKATKSSRSRLGCVLGGGAYAARRKTSAHKRGLFVGPASVNSWLNSSDSSETAPHG